MSIYKTIFVCLHIFIIFASAQDEEDSTVEIVTIETTTVEVIVITDLSQEEVDAALKIEVGEYTTMRFDYINAQFPNNSQVEQCFDEYIKCSVSKGISMPMCAISFSGYFTYQNYCDFYLDICRRGHRYHWVLDVGYCNFYQGEFTDVDLTRRLLGLVGEPWNFIFKTPAQNALESSPRDKYVI